MRSSSGPRCLALRHFQYPMSMLNHRTVSIFDHSRRLPAFFPLCCLLPRRACSSVNIEYLLSGHVVVCHQLRSFLALEANSYPRVQTLSSVASAWLACWWSLAIPGMKNCAASLYLIICRKTFQSIDCAESNLLPHILESHNHRGNRWAQPQFVMLKPEAIIIIMYDYFLTILSNFSKLKC